MSRIGKQPIKIENNVEVQVLSGGEFGNVEVVVKGPKGELKQSIRKGIDVEVKDGFMTLKRANDDRHLRAYHGLYRSLINNMVIGVSKGFVKELEIVGVGYKAVLKGNVLELSLGLTHPIEFDIPEGITINVSDNTQIKIEGIDKHLVGEVVATIRALKKPEPYKGKGIRYKGEQVRRKAGKAVATTT